MQNRNRETFDEKIAELIGIRQVCMIIIAPLHLELMYASNTFSTQLTDAVFR